MKKIISIILSFCMLISFTSVLSIKPVIANASTYLSVSQLKAKFPAGKYWNHGSAANNPDGYTSSPCTHHGNCSGSYLTGACGCNSYNGGIQCFGFALKLGSDAFGGSNVREWKRVNNLDSLKPGDIIDYKNDKHTIFVIGVSGNTITFADCNSDNQCKIRWDQTISKSEVLSTLARVYVAPSTLKTDSLGAPTNVKMNCIGKKLTVTWNAVPGANCYDVILTDPSGTTNYYHTNGPERIIELTKTGTYKVNVQSLYRPNGSTTGQKVGAHSAEVTTTINLFGPENVNVEVKGKKIIATWNAVSGANCYDVILTDPSGTTNYYHTNGTERIIYVSKTGTYKLNVQSLYRPNGSTTGQKVGAHSAEVATTVNLLGPENLNIEVKDNYFYLTWDMADGANCYDIIVTDPTGNSTWYHSIDPNKIIKINSQPGNWKFKIQSLYRPNGTSDGQTVGGYSDEKSVDVQMQAPQNISVDNKNGRFNVYWDIVSGANCYDVVVTKPNGETTWLHSETNSVSTDSFEYGYYELWIQGIYRTSELNIGGAHSETVSYDYKPVEETCEHLWDSGVVTEKASCSQTGVMEYTCQKCSYKRTEVIEKTNHTVIKDNPVKPTCTEKGLSEGSHCSVCGAIVVAQKEIPENGHISSNPVKENEKAATCSKEGSYENVVYCVICGEELSREAITIEKTAHTPKQAVKEKYIAATCTESGEYELVIYCSVCNTELVREEMIVEPIGHKFSTDDEYCLNGCGTKNPEYSITHSHTWDSGVIIKQATCKESGLKVYICSDCGETKTVIIPQKSHNYITRIVAPTCTEKGYTLMMCSICGEETKTNYTFETGHKAEALKAVPATFTASGKTAGSKCSVCGKIIVAQKTVAKLGSPKLSKVTAAKKAFTAKWAAVSGIDGYQIRYSLKSNMKASKTIGVANTATSKKVKKLKAKKTYYVQIRAYKTVNGKKLYSSWSAKKKVKTK